MKIAVRNHELYRQKDWRQDFVQYQDLLESAPYLYKILEIDDSYSDCEYQDFVCDNGVWSFSSALYENRKDLARIQSEKNEIAQWFDNEYAQVLASHARAQRMGMECEYNIAEYDDIAEQKKARLEQLHQHIVQ